MYRVGIVGCGMVAKRFHLPVYRNIANVEVVAAADPNEKALETFVKESNVKGKYTEYKDLLDRENLDVLDVCTPPHLHAEVVNEAAPHGLNIIVEKPLALSSSEAGEIITTCKHHDVKLCAIEDHLFFPVVRQTKSMLDEGKLGNVLSLYSILRRPSIEPGWRRDDKLSGGILLEDGIHHMMMHRFFLNEIRTIFATERDTRHVDQSVHYEIILQGENANGMIYFTRSQGFDDSFYLYGSKCNAIVTIPQNLLVTSYGSLLPEFLSVKKAFLFWKNNRKSKGAKNYLLGHYHQFKDFFESIERNSEPSLPAHMVKEGMVLVEKARRSITTRSAIKV